MVLFFTFYRIRPFFSLEIRSSFVLWVKCFWFVGEVCLVCRIFNRCLLFRSLFLGWPPPWSFFLVPFAGRPSWAPMVVPLPNPSFLHPHTFFPPLLPSFFFSLFSYLSFSLFFLFLKTLFFFSSPSFCLCQNLFFSSLLSPWNRLVLLLPFPLPHGFDLLYSFVIGLLFFTLLKSDCSSFSFPLHASLLLPPPYSSALSFFSSEMGLLYFIPFSTPLLFFSTPSVFTLPLLVVALSPGWNHFSSLKWASSTRLLESIPLLDFSNRLLY